nr:immunoglobulin light chain junction region [Macaca mulatta]
CVQLLEFPFIF